MFGPSVADDASTNAATEGLTSGITDADDASANAATEGLTCGTTGLILHPPMQQQSVHV